MGDVTPRMPSHGDGLATSFREFVAALGAGDPRVVERFFAPGEQTLLVRRGGMVVGFAEVLEAVRAEPLADPGHLLQTHLREIGPDGTLVTAAHRSASGGEGVMGLLWERTEQGWRIAAAHLVGPEPALDRAVWCEVGDPLAPALGSGPLDGLTLAVAENVHLAGRPVGIGCPGARPYPASADRTAPVLLALQQAGVRTTGRARIEELGIGDTGDHHAGLPRNVRAPGRLPGGATCGPVAAVALGQSDVGLGLDSGGSLLLPAANQGVLGLRTTHGAVSVEGIVPTAPSLDAVGWVARDAEVLARVADVLLPERGRRRVDEVILVPEVLALADPDVAAAIQAVVDRWDASLAPLRMLHHGAEVLADWAATCRDVRHLEVAERHADWVDEAGVQLGAEASVALRSGRSMDRAQAGLVRRRQAAARAAVAELLGNAVLVLPTAATVAPSRSDAGGPGRRGRDRTRHLLAVSAAGGLPAISLPLATRRRLPCGLALVGPVGSDHALVGLARRLADAGVLAAT